MATKKTDKADKAEKDVLQEAIDAAEIAASKVNTSFDKEKGEIEKGIDALIGKKKEVAAEYDKKIDTLEDAYRKITGEYYLKASKATEAVEATESKGDKLPRLNAAGRTALADQVVEFVRVEGSVPLSKLKEQFPQLVKVKSFIDWVKENSTEKVTLGEEGGPKNKKILAKK